MTMRNIEVPEGNQFFWIKAEEGNNHIWFHFRGRVFVINKKIVKKTSASEEKPEAIEQKSMLSPMPGQIVKVFVTPGMKVKENQTLVVLSSMKMEYTIKSPVKAVVKLIKVKEGEQVTAHQELVLFD